MDALIDAARAAAADGDTAAYEQNVQGFVDKAFAEVPRIPLFQPYAQRRAAEEHLRLPLLVPPAARLPHAGQGLRRPRPRSDGARPCWLMALKRLVLAVPSLIGVVIVTFLLTRALPGDPAAYFAGPAATKEAIEQIRVKLGLDQPLPVQFVRYVGDLARGDLGSSLTTGQPVATEIRARLPASAELTLLGLIVSVAIAVPLGILAATRPGSLVDHTCRVLATAGVSLPVFFTGLILVYVFYYLLGCAPAPLGRLDMFYSAPPQVTGFYLIDSAHAGDWEVFRASLKQLILPALTLGIFSLAPIARMTRASMLAVLASDFVRTARASGLSPFTVVVHLRVPQRDAAGGDHARHGVLLPARRQRAGREGVRLARHRLLRGGGADRLRLRARAGLRADHGGDVRGAELLIDILYGLIDPRVRIEA